MKIDCMAAYAINVSVTDKKRNLTMQTMLERQIPRPHPISPIITRKTGCIWLGCVAPVYSPGVPGILERLPSPFSDITSYLMIVEKRCVTLFMSSNSIHPIFKTLRKVNEIFAVDEIICQLRFRGDSGH
jgi:hypothetical protein